MRRRRMLTRRRVRGRKRRGIRRIKRRSMFNVGGVQLG